MTHFEDLAQTLDKVSAVSSRLEKIRILADILKNLEQNEVRPAALFLSGRVLSENDTRSLNVSWRGLWNALKKVMDFSDADFRKVYEGDTGEAVASLMSSGAFTRQATLSSDLLTIESLANSVDKISDLTGKGSKKDKESILVQMLSNASPIEAKYLVALIIGDMRTGVSERLLAEAVAVAYDANPDLVRRAWQFTGDLGTVASIAAKSGESGLKGISIEVMRPVKPMLAVAADTLLEIFENAEGSLAFELKFDGARVQIHKSHDSIRIFSRKLVDVTESFPEILEIMEKEVQCESVVLDGEIVAVDPSGKPYPFQVVMRRFGRVKDVKSKSQEIRVVLFLFDILLKDEKPLVDRPYKYRRKQLEKLVPSYMLTKSIHTDEISGAQEFFEKSRELGHEGIMAKKLDSIYSPGRRGKNWFKIKHALEHLDLVIIAAEWGYGRRSKWLSNYHLAVLDEVTGKYAMVGKTFKGLTDKEFQEMTDRLLQISVEEHGHVVKVRPEVVVEVLASEIQESPTYRSGMALRFARIVAVRHDKTAEDATTLRELKSTYEAQFRYKAR